MSARFTEGLGGCADPKAASLRALGLLNFFVADVQTGMGPYLTLFLRKGAGWDASRIGTAVATGYLALVLSQIPVGAWIDSTRHKRGLIVLGAALVVAACVSTALFTRPDVVTAGQALIGFGGAIFAPCIAAISLGMVGRRRLDAQQGSNQSHNAAGNVAAAVVTGVVGQYVGLRWMFVVLGVFCASAMLFALRLRPGDIDNALARGADDEAGRPAGTEDAPPARFVGRLLADLAGLRQILGDRRVLVFTVAALLLNLSNGAMAPLVTQQIADQRDSHYAPLWTGAFMIAVQAVYMAVAGRAGRLAAAWGRKPLYAATFALVALRGVLLCFGHSVGYLVAVQSVDGVVAGISSVVSVLIIADLTKGTGRFNIAQGAWAAAQGLGGSLSNKAIGSVTQAFGARVSFLSLAGVAVLGLTFFWSLMPETRAAAEGGEPPPT